MSEIKETNEINEIEEDNNICNEHRKKIDFYCIQCSKYFCSECLIIFSEESKKHTNHYIVKVDSINDLGVNEAINEYNKLHQTKGKYEDLIGLCNMKLKENEIKKYETMKYLNTIKDLYIKKLNEESKSIQNMLKEVKIKKNKILAEIELFPSKCQNTEKNNDQNQGQAIIKELKTLNKVDQDLRKQIVIEDSKISSKLYVENYQTEFLDFIIQGSGQRFHDNQILVSSNLTISNYNCNLIMKHVQKKVIILFYIKINEPYNSPNYPIFQTSIVFKNNKFGLEFITLTNQIISQNLAGQFAIGQNQGQLNSLELDVEKFLFLINEDNKLCLKIFVNKSFYK
jgi:transposase-like protein